MLFHLTLKNCPVQMKQEKQKIIVELTFSQPKYKNC